MRFFCQHPPECLIRVGNQGRGMAKTPRTMNDDDLSLLQAIAENPSMTRRKLVDIRPDIESHWDSSRYFLHSRGLIQSQGQKRGARWSLTDLGEAMVRNSEPAFAAPRYANFANDGYHLGDEAREEMIAEVAVHLDRIMRVMGIDVDNDHNSKDSPHRIAKAWINDTMRGRFGMPPNITSFPNAANHSQMILSGPIRVVSMCSHHWAPFIGEAFVAYIPGDTVIGLSKLSRIVDFFARRPQIQEELTQQITDYLDEVIPNNVGTAVMIRASHQCMTCRGVEDPGAKMTTSELRGAFFANASARQEFFDLCRDARGYQ